MVANETMGDKMNVKLVTYILVSIIVISSVVIVVDFLPEAEKSLVLTGQIKRFYSLGGSPWYGIYPDNFNTWVDGKPFFDFGDWWDGIFGYTLKANIDGIYYAGDNVGDMEGFIIPNYNSVSSSQYTLIFDGVHESTFGYGTSHTASFELWLGGSLLETHEMTLYWGENQNPEPSDDDWWPFW